MTFPAGGGDTGAPTTAAPPPATPTTDSAPAAPAADSGSDEGKQAATTQPPATDKPAAPAAPKVEPKSFRDTLESLRHPVSGDERPTEAAPPAKPEAKPAPETPAPAPTKPAVEAKPTEVKPTAPKQDAATAAPEVKAEEEAAPTDDELLKSENLDEALEKRFPEADKGKRGALDFAKRMAARARDLAPIAEAIEAVGGMEGANLAFEYTRQLAALARPAATPEEALAQAETYRDFLYKSAPAAAGKLESTIFWKAVEDTPEGRANVQALADEIFGDGVVTLDQVKSLVNLFADGKIDLDDLVDQHGDYTLTKREREDKAREESKKSAYTKGLEERLAKVEGKDKETEEAKETARVGQVRGKMLSFVQGNYSACQPILREYGFVLPDDPKSPAYKSMQIRIRHIQRDLEEAMQGDEDYEAVIGNINNLQFGGVHSINEGAARRKMMVKLRAILDDAAPEAATEVKRKNELIAKSVKAKPATTTQPAKPPTSATAPASERAMMSVEEQRQQRRDSLKAAIDEGRRANA